MTVKVGVSGAAGRMGREVVSTVHVTPSTTLVAALEPPEHPHIGKDATLFHGFPSGIKISSEFFSADVYIDFSVPAATLKLARHCRETKTALVVGTTGFNDVEKKELESAAADIPLVVAPNMSLGVHIMFALVKHAAQLLKTHDMEIFEAHHRNKKDAPSGTALRLGEIMAKAAKKDFAPVFSRMGSENERKDGEIGFSVMRAGDIVGEHRAVFVYKGEQLEIVHRATDRMHFATGAVVAAEFVCTAAPGLYGMDDVLERKGLIYAGLI